VTVQVPEECEHQAGNDGLEHQGLVGHQSSNQAERERNRHRRERNTRQNCEQLHQRNEPERDARMWCGEFAGAALAADFGIPRIRMPVRTEFGIVGAPAEVAEQRLAGSQSMTLVAIAHRILEERVPLISFGPQPDWGPDTVAMNVVEGGEPENLVRRFRDGRADVGEPSVRVRNHKNAELRLAEFLCEFRRKPRAGDNRRSSAPRFSALRFRGRPPGTQVV